jgi:predicted secreted Zn-dependent protease
VKSKRKHYHQPTGEREEIRSAPNRAAKPEGHDPMGLLALQHSLGNRAVQGLVRDGAIQEQAILLAPKGKTAKGSYDMGSPVSNASERFYRIAEPSLSKVASKFKFVDEDGNRLAGETRWDVQIKSIPKGGITKKGGMWTVDSIPWAIKRITVDLPKWQNFAKAPDADKKEWARFVKCTRTHEQGHADRVRKFMNKDMPAEWKSASAPTVKALKQRLKALGALVKAKLQEMSDDYDTDTGHGATQGATLKPPASP